MNTSLAPQAGAFDHLDHPSPEAIDRLRAAFQTERETDELLTRKLQRRSGPPYRRQTLAELTQFLHAMLTHELGSGFEISGQGWFTGGVSKIQMGFTLDWTDPVQGARRERLVVRMDPSESLNVTSRAREFELIRLFEGRLPVPKVFWLDPDGRFFPEPALLYAFAEGVTKPRQTATGKVSGLGTVFGERLRGLLAPQFMQHLALIHTLDVSGGSFTSLDMPETGTSMAMRWQLDRARRIWEEDRGHDYPLLEVAVNWLERNLPVLDRVSVVHGDFRSGNFLFDESSGHINAWLDWERGHLGDRHRDLAWLTQWPMGHFDEDGKTYYVCGLVALDRFYDEYQRISGLTVDAKRLAWWRILNACQILVSTLATNYRVARLGKSHQDILLTRVRGVAPSVALDLAHLLEEHA
jgi:aminoglycoside phosphotransferase (APT) family kinase protein